MGETPGGQCVQVGHESKARAPPSLYYAVCAAVALVLMLDLAKGLSEHEQHAQEEEFMAWLKSKGVQHNVTIKTPVGGERGLYATKAMRPGDIIARIPVTIAMWFDDKSSPNMEDWAVTLAEEAVDAGSKYKPWMDVLPMAHDPTHTITTSTFPVEYLPLIRSKVMKEYITGTQRNTHAYWLHNERRLVARGVTLEKLRAALNTFHSRSFTVAHQGEARRLMLPLIDFANHMNECINEDLLGRCDFFEKPEYFNNNHDGRHYGGDDNDIELQDLCMFWTAGQDIKEGEELCLRYHQEMTPDNALLIYGYNLPDDPPPLSRLDWAEYSWDIISGHPQRRVVDGPLEAVESELRRVRKRIRMLTGLEEAEAAMTPAPSDPGGVTLRRVKVLRRQRLAALRGEERRLEGRAEALKGSGGGGEIRDGDPGWKQDRDEL